MVTVPKLDRLTPSDTANFRFAGTWQKMCEKIEEAFTEIIDNQTTIAAVQAALATKAEIYRQNDAPVGATEPALWLDENDGDKAYWLISGVWTAAQDIGAAYARLGINPDGTIANDKVVNASVLAGAVIGADAGYTATSTAINSGSSGPFNTYVEVADKSFTSTGREVEIAVAARIEVHDNCEIIYRLLCDGVQVEDEIGPVTVNTGNQVPLSYIWAHTPSAAAHDYTLEVQCNNNGITVHNPLISPRENRNL